MERSTLDVEPLSSSSVGSVVMSAVRSTARSSPPSADERLATGGPSRRRGAGGEDRANAPFSGTSNARGSREAVSIRMAPRWGSNREPVTDPRPRVSRPARRPDATLRVRHEDKDTFHERAFDDRHRGLSSRVARAPFECPSRPRGRRERAARRRDRLVRGDACSSARACVGEPPRAKGGLGHPGVFPRERVLWRKKPRSDARIQLAVQRTSKESSPGSLMRRIRFLKTSARFAPRIV